MAGQAGGADRIRDESFRNLYRAGKVFLQGQ
jgi:hypothetical protein